MRLAITFALLIILQTATPVPRQATNDTTGSAAQVQKQANRRKDASAPTPIQNARSAAGNQHERDDPTATSEQGHVIVDSLPKLNTDKDIWDRVYIVLTGLLVAIGALTLRAIWYQAKKTAEAAKAAADSVEAIIRQAGIMERQTAATEKSAKAASDNISLIINKERARIHIEMKNAPVMGDPDDPLPTGEVIYVIRCYGTTPASILETRAWADVNNCDRIGGSSCQTLSDSYLGMLLPSVLTPTVDGIEMRAPLSGDGWAEGVDMAVRIAKREMFVHFSGFIKYADIFGGKWVYAFQFMWHQGFVFAGGQWIGHGEESKEEQQNESVPPN